MVPERVNPLLDRCLRDILAADHLAVGKIGGLVPLDLRIQTAMSPAWITPRPTR
ncbi:MAG TPA: hypothetical protein VFY90_02540 [Tepidiformaceae bacterium]|nr:hypothetical protein [Tepidiformaceae bacterium]